MRIEESKYTFPDGREVLIRSAVPNDAEKIKELREVTSAETHFMARDPEDGPFNAERIIAVLGDIERSTRDFTITAFYGDEVVGDLSVMTVRPHLKLLHRAALGVSIRQAFAGGGLGSYMIKAALDQARKNGFEQVELGVYSDNEKARHVYAKAGFKEYGRTPKAYKLKDGSYRDEIIMVNIFDE